MTTTALGTSTGKTHGSDSQPRSLVTSPAAPRSNKLLLWCLLVIVIIACVAVIAWWVERASADKEKLLAVDKTVLEQRSFVVSLKEKGELRAAKSEQIKCEVEGRSTIISLIKEGSKVEEGDLLVELASDEIDERIQQQELQEAAKLLAYDSAKTELEIQRDRNASDIRKAELQIELMGLALKKYEEGDWTQSLRDAEIAIESAEITLRRAKEDAEASEELFEKEYITKAEHDEDQFAYDRAKWDLEKAKLAKQVLVEYTDKTDRTQRQSDLDEAIKECERIKKNADAEEAKRIGSLEASEKELALTRTQLEKLRCQKEKCTMRAPSPGFVVYGDSDPRRWWGGDSGQIKEGASVHERQVLMTLPDRSTMVASVRIHEAKTSKIRIGLPVEIEIEGIPDQLFSGTITKIAQLADSQNRWLNPDLKEYETEITLNESHELLKPGGTAHTEIIIQKVENVLAVPPQSVFMKRGHRFVFRYDRGDIEPVEVVLGAIGTEWAEVLDGVNVGDQILLAPSEDQERLLPEVEPMQLPGRLPPGAPKTAAKKQQHNQPTTTDEHKSAATTKAAAEREEHNGAKEKLAGNSITKLASTSVSESPSPEETD